MSMFNLGELLGGLGDEDACPTGEAVLEAVESKGVMSSTGKPMLRIKARIVGGPHAGRVVNEQLVVTTDNPDALFFLVAKLEAWGIGDKSLLDQCVDTLDPLAKAVVGNRANVVLRADTWNKRVRPKVEEYLGAAGSAEAEGPGEPDAFPLDDDDPGF